MMTFPKSVDIKKFKVFLDSLRSRFFFDDLCIFMDNLSVHVSKVVKERMDELGIRYIYNAPYSPDFNPIENTFSVASQMIKRRRLEAIMRGEKIDLKKVIHESFDQIKRESI